MISRTRLFGPRETRAFGADDEWALDENRMLDHGVENLRVADLGVEQAELFGFRRLGAQRLARREAGVGEELLELRLGPAGFQILDHLGFVAGGLDHLQHLARGGAFRVVIDGDRDFFAIAQPHSSATMRAISACAALRAAGSTVLSLQIDGDDDRRACRAARRSRHRWWRCARRSRCRSCRRRANRDGRPARRRSRPVGLSTIQPISFSRCAALSTLVVEQKALQRARHRVGRGGVALDRRGDFR